jgi:sugar phosphate isomerase/epimerase
MAIEARALAGHGAAVVVSRDAERAFAGWAHQGLWFGAFALAGALAIGVMVYLIAHQFKTHAALAEIHAEKAIAALDAEKSEIERARLAAEAELLKSERLSVMGQLTASVAHAQRNPLSTIPETLELISDAGGSPSLGLQFDTWHLWNAETVLDDIGRHIDRITGVHVSDVRRPERSWCDRVLPGDGVADVPALIGALHTAGWDGLYDLEIFSDNGTFGTHHPDSLWDVPAAELARRGRAATAAAWETVRRLAPVGQPQQPKEDE